MHCLFLYFVVVVSLGVVVLGFWGFFCFFTLFVSPGALC